MRIVLASSNEHKIREIRQILDGTGIEVLGLEALGAMPEIPEDHDSFEENALQKANFVFVRTGEPCVADDSGLEVDALDGRPGVHSKRFTAEATAESNNRHLLELMHSQSQRTARFRCVLALVGPKGQATVSGACEGEIARSASGDGGFGYDPLFLPVEFPGRSMAELSPEEKNRMSHRGRAFRQLPALLEQLGLL
jgi:XTP/dITP diphosphohydrolase